MKKWLVLLLSLALLLPLAASAQEVVNVYNWEDYIDEAVLDQFEEETGIHVNYMRFTTNEDMMVSVRANPGAYDVIYPLRVLRRAPHCRGPAGRDQLR